MAGSINRRDFITATSGAFATVLLAGCGAKQEPAADDQVADDTPAGDDAAIELDTIDYLALVNKQHQLPEGWEEALETVTMTNSEDWDAVAARVLQLTS